MEKIRKIALVTTQIKEDEEDQRNVPSPAFGEAENFSQMVN
ncbi:hypothetical protein [Algoriphagus antarcticus]|nr:hypothetical protein [Algoriphagus antarcticus]